MWFLHCISPKENHDKGHPSSYCLFFALSSDDTVNLTSSAAPFHTTRIFASPRVERSRWSNFTEHLSRGLDDDIPFRSVQSLLIRRQWLPLSDLDLTHHDRLATIDLLHNAMDHRADPIHIAPLERLVAALYRVSAIKRTG